jgi:hypothetical protein
MYNSLSVKIRKNKKYHIITISNNKCLGQNRFGQKEESVMQGPKSKLILFQCF